MIQKNFTLVNTLMIFLLICFLYITLINAADCEKNQKAAVEEEVERGYYIKRLNKVPKQVTEKKFFAPSERYVVKSCDVVQQENTCCPKVVKPKIKKEPKCKNKPRKSLNTIDKNCPYRQSPVKGTYGPHGYGCCCDLPPSIRPPPKQPPKEIKLDKSCPYSKKPVKDCFGPHGYGCCCKLSDYRKKSTTKLTKPPCLPAQPVDSQYETKEILQLFPDDSIEDSKLEETKKKSENTVTECKPTMKDSIWYSCLSALW